jgi:hypothetical protein
MVGEELHEVLRSGNVSEAEIRDAFEGAGFVGRGDRVIPGSAPRCLRIVAENISFEPITDFCDGRTSKQRRGPQIFGD